MEVKELRIGNILQDIQYKSPMRIVQFYGTSMFELDSPYMDYTDYRCDADLNKYEPIPLTEEWLVKFGFTKDKNLFFHDKCSYIQSDAYNCGGGFGYCLNDEKIDFLHIKYVHQLQNLYFALTGEELTIN